MQPTENDVLSFLESIEHSSAVHLTNTIDPARVISLMAFSDFVKQMLPNNLKVAIVSGENEPELLFLRDNTCEVDYFNWSEENQIWDLTEDWRDGRLDGKSESYDLVLCEQVLEHLPFPATAVNNLALLLKKGGYLHINTPALCGFHGSPYYFYAGFHPNTLEIYVQEAQLKVVESDAWYTTKGVRMYSICDWAGLTISGGRLFRKFRPQSGTREKLRAIKHKSTWFQRISRHNRYYSKESLFNQNSTKNAVISWVIGQK